MQCLGGGSTPPRRLRAASSAPRSSRARQAAGVVVPGSGFGGRRSGCGKGGFFWGDEGRSTDFWRRAFVGGFGHPLAMAASKLLAMASKGTFLGGVTGRGCSYSSFFGVTCEDRTSQGTRASCSVLVFLAVTRDRSEVLRPAFDQKRQGHFGKTYRKHHDLGTTRTLRCRQEFIQCHNPQGKECCNGKVFGKTSQLLNT